MIWTAIAILLALDLGILVGWALRARLEQSAPMPVRITPPVLPARLVRAVARVSSPELARWN